MRTRTRPCTRRDVADALLPVEAAEDVRTLKAMLQQHLKYTGSPVARKVGGGAHTCTRAKTLSTPSMLLGARACAELMHPRMLHSRFLFACGAAGAAELGARARVVREGVPHGVQVRVRVRGVGRGGCA